MKKVGEDVCISLREVLIEAVKRNNAEVLLLSGGLDTSILAALTNANDKNKNKKAFTVALDGASAPDLRYTKKVAQKFCYEYHLICMTESEALREIPMVIQAVRSFDPAIPNDLVIYAALQEAKHLGIKSVMTGDGADELFAGYSYMLGLSQAELKRYITTLSKTMCFSSNKLGAFLGVEIKQPYCDRKIVDFATKLSPSLKIRERDGRKYGKWILRKAFEAELGAAVAWREKEPIEFGSGTTKLRDIISENISDTEFEQKKREYRMEFMNKEHLSFYEHYRNVVGEVPGAKEGENACPLCRAVMPEERIHCSICGFSYPLRA